MGTDSSPGPLEEDRLVHGAHRARGHRVVPRVHDPRPGAVDPRRVRAGGTAAVAGRRPVGRVRPGLRTRRPRSEAAHQRRRDRPHRRRPARHLDPGRLRLRLPRVPVPACPVRGVHGHADAAHRGDADPQRRHDPGLGPAQQLPRAGRAVPRHRVRHLPHPPGVPRHPPRPARRRRARRLRPPGLPAPGRHPGHPADHRVVHRDRVPVGLEPVHVAPGRGHRGPVGDHPDRPEDPVGHRRSTRTTSASPRPSSPPSPCCCSSSSSNASSSEASPPVRSRADPNPSRKPRTRSDPCPRSPNSPAPCSPSCSSPPRAAAAATTAPAATPAARPTDTIVLPDCPVDALDSATTPVDITVWYQLSGKAGSTLEAQVAAYNASQDKVRVTAELQGANYDELFNKYTQGIPTGDLPHILISEDTTTQALIDSRDGAARPVVLRRRRAEHRRLRRGRREPLHRRRGHVAGHGQRLGAAHLLQQEPLPPGRARRRDGARHPGRGARVRRDHQGRRRHRHAGRAAHGLVVRRDPAHRCRPADREQRQRLRARRRPPRRPSTHR